MRSILLEGRTEEKRTVRISTFYFHFLGLKRIATRYHITNALAQYTAHESEICFVYDMVLILSGHGGEDEHIVPVRERPRHNTCICWGGCDVVVVFGSGT